MKLRCFSDEAVDIVGDIPFVATLAWEFIFCIQAKCIAIVPEKCGSTIVLHPAAKCSSLLEHLENRLKDRIM
jgi:hypothetical protein